MILEPPELFLGELLRVAEVVGFDAATAFAGGPLPGGRVLLIVDVVQVGVKKRVDLALTEDGIIGQ
ncbi:MAG: hypothetical protein U5Q44_10330 [Dehalococcoidia bacterium]|nr:hypothetical protein [Dehalococcoidia bacterium]